MANTYRSRTADVAEFADDDPFAELTRIIGHDAQPRRDHAADESLGLDLENELLGGLAEFEPHDQASAGSAAPAEQPLAEDVAQAIDAEFEAAFGSGPTGKTGQELGEPVSDTAEAAEPQPPVFEFPQAPDWADETPEATSEFAPADMDFIGDANAEAEAEIAVSDLSLDEDDLALDEPAEIVSEAAFEPEGFHESEAPEAVSWRPAEISAEADAGLSDATAEQPVWSDDVSSEGTIDPATLSEPDSTQVQEDRIADDWSSSFDRPEEPQIEDAVLEDEEPGGIEAEASAPALDDLPQTAEVPEVSSDISDQEGSEPPFDYVKAAADRHDFLEDVSEPGDLDPFATATEPATAGPFLEPDAIDASEGPEAPEHEPEEPQYGIHGYTTAGAVAGGALAAGLAGTHFWTPKPLKPAAGQEDSVAAYSASPQPAADLGFETAAVAPDGEGAGDGAPLIETLDIEEKPVAVFDDIDIPEPAPPEEPVRAQEFDDLAVELAAAFGSMSDEATASPQSSAAAAPAHAEENGLFNGSMARAEAGGDYAGLFDPHADAGAAFTAHEQQGQQGFAGWVDETPSDPMEPEEDFVPPQQMRGAVVGRRGLVAAALVGAVVVIGGVGIFAFSGGGAGTGEPAIVKASDEPIKVKPKNPGGSTVPDQSSEVYRRASGAPVDQKPEQKELVTTAEKPIDLQQNDQPRIVDASAVRPRSGESALDAAMSEQAEQIAADAVAEPKSDDRLAPSDTAPAAAANEPAITVTPHRVNTFIVKPDGTMVPREVPAEVASAPESAASEVMAEGVNVPAAEEGDAAASLASAETATAPASPTIEAPAVHPTPAPEPAQQVASREPAAAPKQPLAPAGSSEWSVQISSQPTAEAAQQSYQNMAQRYGDLLTGRGVNIVKADIAGKGTYYRVRIPSASKDDAINLCSRLKDAGGNCFVSK